MTRVVAFDVFDTLLTRRVGEPQAVFALVGDVLRERGVVTISPVAFRDARVFAEQRAREDDPAGEPGLAEVSERLAGLLGLDPADVATLASAELEVESTQIVPVPGADAPIADARAQGARIVFLSDAYLPRTFIRDRLAQHGFYQEGDTLYISSEVKASKRTGDLFRLVLAREGGPASAITHSGNDPHGDSAVPRALGIATRERPRANLNRYEWLLERHSLETEGLASVFAGASRLARCDLGERSREDLRVVACSVVAPTLTAFVTWVLQRASRGKVDRLYFVSRDGYLLKEIGARIRGPLGVGTEVRYLHGSRQAWHAAAAFELDDSDREWVLDAADGTTVRSALARVHISPEEVAGSLVRCGFHAREWDRELAPERFQCLWSLLRGDEEVRTVLRVRSAETRELASAYLRQEGFGDGTRSAIVDLGWHGRIERSLRRLIGSGAGALVGGYYVGLLGGVPAEIASSAETFLFRGAASSIRDAACLLESFCTAPHGSVLGYRREGERIAPLLREIDHRLEAWGLEMVHAAVIRFAERVAESISARHKGVFTQRMVEHLLEEFSRRPSLGEASAWGSFPYEDGQAGEPGAELVPKIPSGVLPFLRALRFGTARVLYSRTPRVLWEGGTERIAESTRAMGLALRIGRVGKRLRDRIRRQLNR